MLRPADLAAIDSMGKRLGVPRGVLGGLFELESGHKADIWGGDKGKYFGAIQFGEGARRETGLNPRIHTTIESQEPYILKYFQQRGYNPGDYPDLPSRARALYRTVLVGNPRQSGTDSFGTNSDKAALRMLPGGDLYQRAEARYSRVPGGGGGSSAQPPAALRAPSPPIADGGTLRTAPAGSSVRSVMMDPFVSTAKAGLEPRDQGHALMAALFAELAERNGTSDFAPALREAIGPLNAMEPLSKLQAREAAAIFGTQQRMATGHENTPLQSFQPFQASTPDAMQSSGNPISAPTNGRGPVRVGKIAHPSQDIYPTTGPHLDVRVMKNGEYVNPEFARSLLQNLRVGGKPLYSQSGEGWSPAYPITSGFGPRSAPTAGASTFHRGVDFGVPEGVELEWTGGGTYSRQPGYGQIDLPTGERIKLLHTIG